MPYNANPFLAMFNRQPTTQQPMNASMQDIIARHQAEQGTNQAPASSMPQQPGLLQAMASRGQQMSQAGAGYGPNGMPMQQNPAGAMQQQQMMGGQQAMQGQFTSPANQMQAGLNGMQQPMQQPIFPGAAQVAQTLSPMQPRMPGLTGPGVKR